MVDETKRSSTGVSRRQILRGVAAGAAAGGASMGLWTGCKYRTQMFLLDDPPQADVQRPSWSESSVRQYRPLGKTGFEMSDISFGTAGLSDPAVARHGVEKGINYFDTSPDYSHASSERALGSGIKGRQRDKLFVVSKLCTPDGHLASDTPMPKVVEAVEGSLRRIGTDYLDLVHIHAVNSIDRLMAPTLHEAFDRLKEQGKVRFLGVSSHTPDLETVMRHAVRSGRFDVIMVAYNFKNWPELTGIFHEANERGVGVVAMKTLKGAHHTKLADFTPSERESFAQAAFKWVLRNPDVSGLVVSMSRYEQVDEYLGASGQPATGEDIALLEKYDQLIAGKYCRPGCGDCLDACPYEVPVNDILRYSMYYENYGREKDAMRMYAKLDEARNAAQCLGCAAPCEARCEFGIPIREQLTRAHETLRWS